MSTTFSVSRCPLCGGKTSHRQVIETASWGKYSIQIDGVGADVCDQCGEKYYSQEDAKVMQHIAEALSDSTQLIKTQGTEVILNITETANILKVSNQSVYNMIKDGRIRAKKIGREWRFLKSEIEAMIRPNEPAKYLYAARNGEALSDHDKDIVQSVIREESDCE